MVVKRFAFSMIELIFAIVIVAIAVISLPVLTATSTDTTTKSIETEEALFKAYIYAVQTTDKAFSDVNTTAKASAQTQIGGLAGYKFNQKYKVDVTTTGDIKKVDITIYDENNNELVKLYTYKFNI